MTDGQHMTATARSAVQFTCANCGAEVPWRKPPEVEVLAGVETLVFRSHDACPECEWSRHVVYGTNDQPPCGAMMEPVHMLLQNVTHNAQGQFVTEKVPFVVRRCLGCGWETTAPPQRLQAKGRGYDDIAFCQFGANGDGRKMASRFDDLNYQMSLPELPGDAIPAAYRKGA